MTRHVVRATRKKPLGSVATQKRNVGQ